MLHLLFGTAGSGKSALLYERIGAAARGGRPVIVIVPEQFSFETEKTLYRQLGARLAAGVEVLSFTRLCNRIFRTYGGLAGDYIDDSARLLLMSQTLAELGDLLTVYAGKVQSGSLIQALVGQMSEFKNAGVTAEALERFAQDEPEEALRGKTAELARIFAVYQAMIDRGYLDAEDDLTRACGYLEGAPFFTGYEVFVDSFKTFTAGELMLLEHVVAQADRLTVALCADGPEDTEGGMGLFSPIQRTAARLLRFAGEHGVPVAEEPALREHPRFHSGDLAHLEQQVFRARPQPFPEECPGVRLVTAKNQYEEVEFVAAMIREAVRSGLRYRDMVVIGRDLAAYRQAFESVLERYGIPYFLDARVDVESKPLTAAILHAVGAARPRSGLDTDEILALLKTSLLGASPEEVGELENYCFVWEVRGASWLAPFQASPSGFGPRTPEDEARLERVNALRARVAGPLLHLQEAVRSCNGAEYARAVYGYLEEAGILAALRAGDGSAPDQTAPLPSETVEDCAQLYDTVVDLLDQFALALAETHLPAQRFAELLRLVLCSVDIGEIPQTLDQVTIGSADRIRVGAPRVAFLVGVNEGVFPMPTPSGGILSGEERGRLIEFGLEIADTAQNFALEETFSAYMALCGASERLYLCWPRSNLKGEALYPSPIIKQVRSILPRAEQLEAGAAPDVSYIHNGKTAYDRLCRRLRVDDALTASLAEYLRETGAGERVERLLRPADPAAFRLRDPAVLRRLYGGDIAVSPSRMDQFHQCRMAHFCRYDLSLRPRRKAELSPLESGTVVHFVLQALLTRYPGDRLQELTARALRREVRALLEQYIEEKMGGAEDKTARFRYLFTRLENTLVRLVQHLAEEFAVSAFRPAFFELPIRRAREDDPPDGARVDPLELELPDGGRVRVEGVVDRVDLLEKGGVRYLRVVDYKTGSKEFSLSDVYYGMNLQMLVYLFTIQAMGRGDLERITPAGILYMPARTSFALLDRSAPEEKAVQKQMDALRMNGLLLKSLEAIEGMEKGCGGVFLPVSVKVTEREGEPPEAAYKGPVATLAEFGRLERYVQGLIVQMAGELREGRIAALPTYTKNNEMVCEYCEYRGMCGREPDGPRFDAPELGREEFFEQIEQKGRETDGAGELDGGAGAGD